MLLVKVDLKKIEDLASIVISPELKKAFQECPKDEKNIYEDRLIKFLIVYFKADCKLES